LHMRRSLRCYAFEGCTHYQCLLNTEARALHSAVCIRLSCQQGRPAPPPCPSCEHNISTIYYFFESIRKNASKNICTSSIHTLSPGMSERQARAATLSVMQSAHTQKAVWIHMYTIISCISNEHVATIIGSGIIKGTNIVKPVAGLSPCRRGCQRGRPEPPPCPSCSPPPRTERSTALPQRRPVVRRKNRERQLQS
jgi:hypothetical protein